ncbi:MAG: magnesium chelatase subunit D family protein [Syntrophales bacterium]|jgi:magnesium chelatase subunit D|nr:magnesium chelatase subunit D family protein [Syntrophales bacterium]
MTTATWHKKDFYPFTAIVGQETMIKALILSGIAPSIGGLLIRGEKGTAKSTAVRALAAVLPEIEVVAGCAFNCNPAAPEHFCPDCALKAKSGIPLDVVKRPIPFVTLPLGATEDRVIGSLDMTRAVREGGRWFEPGLLAAVHRGILYVDEANLLDDSLVDIILDSAASGINVVEREGISFRHRCEFILVGTMNPEEGELRPQLLDRFGMCVAVEGIRDPDLRVQVMMLKGSYDKDSQNFVADYRDRQAELAGRMDHARTRLGHVTISDEAVMHCAELAAEASVAGHRADVAMAETARSIAAYRGASVATEDDVREAAEYVLFHRRREAPPHQAEANDRELDCNDRSDKNDRRANEQRSESRDRNPSGGHGMPDPDRSVLPEFGSETNSGETIFATGDPFPLSLIPQKKDRILRRGSGRRTVTRTPSKAGRYVFSSMERKTDDLAFDATLRAAAPHQSVREKRDVAIAVEGRDIREKRREKRIGNFIVFVVDASGSMGAAKRMIETKSAILSLLLDAYQKRDKVSMIAFKGNRAEVLLPPTNSVERAHRLLDELPTGGKTPLAAGIFSGCQLIRTHLRKDPHVVPLLILISDGKANVGIGGGNPLAEAMAAAEEIKDDARIRSVVVDVEKAGLISLGLARKLSQCMGAAYLKIEDLKADYLFDFLKIFVKSQ